MNMSFTQPFLSVAGQKERLVNVADVLSSPFKFTGEKTKVIANVNNPLLKSGLEFVANNPLETAFLATPMGYGSVIKGISSLPTKVKVAGSAIGLVALPAAISNPNLGAAAINLVSSITPTQLVKTGIAGGQATKDIGKEPGKETLQKVIDFAKENKNTLLVGGATAAAFALPTIFGAYSTSKQTNAFEKQAEEAEKQTKLLEKSLSKTKDNEIKIMPTPIAVEPSQPSITPSPKELPSTPLPEGSPNNPIVSPSVGEEPKGSGSICKDNLKKRLKYRKAYKVEEYYKRK